MPELPEVETIKRQLARKIIGKQLKGQKIISVRRRGKLLIIDFQNGSSLVFHLKMTGQLILNGARASHTRRIFRLSDGSQLVFNDVRKFGWWKRLKKAEKELGALGPEPLELNLKSFKDILGRHPRSRIKSLLMDQKAIAGIGNIYSDEILYKARVRPLRWIESLKRDEFLRIFESMKKILKAAIRHHGSSARNYRDLFGKEGGYLKYHKVYQKKECARCGSKLKRVKLNGRSAHYCENCQI
ncbi:MAG: formamidopyrimidine-DNA glycosylase [Parcubacteria group bacterium Gr01-1014_30]|nr:MAG: formamidopyrimidine-DNA glycosylase [Parcubacteria group bacterium Gr01-1014_30]